MKALNVLIGLLFLSVAAQADLVIYTDRPETRMAEITSRFTAKTGVPVIFLPMSSEDMRVRLESEGKLLGKGKSQADVLFVKDIVDIAPLVKDGWLQPMKSEFIKNNVAANMRAADNSWTTVTFRARTLIYNKDLEDPQNEILDISTINTYEDLAKESLPDILCMRTSKNNYQQALSSWLLTKYGHDKAYEIMDGWLMNRAGPTNYPDDGSIIKKVDEGTCGLGITNSYYLVNALRANPNINVGIKFLDQGGDGVHVNGAGAGITPGSTMPEVATQFIEFLLSPEIQTYLSEEQGDFPANINVAPNAIALGFGPFKMDSTSWDSIFPNVPAGIALLKELDFD